MKESDSESQDTDSLNIRDSKDDIKDIARISVPNSQDKKSQSQLKLIKKRKSLPLNQFKVSLPSEARILSSICDNIFEDVDLNENINSSMIKLDSKINLKNSRNDEEINIKTLNSNLDKSKSISFENNNLKNEDIEEESIPQVTLVHKNSFIFNNILKIKKIKCPRLLEEQWKYEKILLDYNIIDFTSKIKYIIFIIY